MINQHDGPGLASGPLLLGRAGPEPGGRKAARPFDAAAWPDRFGSHFLITDKCQ